MSYYLTTQSNVSVGVDGTTPGGTNTWGTTGTPPWLIVTSTTDPAGTSSSARAAAGVANAFMTLAKVYLPADYGATTTVSANATARLGVRSSVATDSYQLALWEYDPATGVVGAAFATSDIQASATTTTSRTFTFTGTDRAIAANRRVMMEIRYRTATSTNIGRVYLNGTTTSQSYVTLTETPAVVNSTAAGTVTAVSATGACDAITVNAPYTNDANSDNTLSYRYRTPTGTGAWVGPTTRTHSASPYNFNITGLTTNADYDVEVTYVDTTDGVTGAATQTVSAITVGANCTVPGTASAAQDAGGTAAITVNAPYTADANTNNTLSYRYQVSGSGTWTSGTRTHAVTPYNFNITGLTCGSSYDVEVTYVDTTDGIGNGGGTAVQTISNVALNGGVCNPATTAGTVSVTPAAGTCNALAVSAPYTGDANANNTLSYRYRTPTGTGAWVGPTTRTHSASPYGFNITGLTTNATYDVEVTYVDTTDGVTGTATQTVSNVRVGANCTVPGTATAVQNTGAPGAAITVGAPYTGDANASNTLSYRYRTPTGTGTWTAPATRTHSVSPYGFDITGLTCGSSYDVEVTYVDTADGIGTGGGAAVQTVSNVVLNGGPCAPAGTIALGDGSAPSSVTVCAAPAVATYIDHFTLLASAGTQVNAVGTTFSASIPAGLLSLLEVTDDAGTALGSATNPSGLNPGVSGMSFAAPTGSTPVQHRLRITPNASTSLSGTFGARITGVTTSGGFTLTGVDSSSATLIVDGTASPDVVPTPSSSAGTVTASWSNPAAGTVPASDFGNYVVVLGNTTSVTNAPAKGTSSYVANGTNTIGADLIVCAGSVASCSRTGLPPNQTYYLKVFTRDGCANWSAGAEVSATTSAFLAEGSSVADAPMVSIVNPSTGKVVSGTYKVQIRIYNPLSRGGIAGLTAGSLGYSTDNGVTWTALDPATSANTRYDTTTQGTVTGRVFEVTITPAVVPGDYTLRARVSNSAASNVTSNTVSISAAVARAGDGNLLVRDNAAQLCNDCHAVGSHTSETTVSARGSWSTTCRDCHSPHATTNISLVSQQITPPALAGPQTPKTVVFLNKGGYAASSYASPTTNNGPCQVCHTRTSYYLSNGGGASHNPTGDCATCHKHGKGFGAICTDCHGDAARAKSGTVAGNVDPRLTAAPPMDTNKVWTGTVKIGAHVAHVNDGRWRTHAIACADCHPSPNTHQGTRDAAWSDTATGFNAVTPSPTVANGYNATWENSPTCSNWCHGAGLTGAGGTNTSPSWLGVSTDADCGKCHASPPPIGDNHPQNDTCSACHGAGYTKTALDTTAKGTHVNGLVNKPANGCTACHGVLAGLSGPAVTSNIDPTAAPGYDALAVDTHGNTDSTVPMPAGVGAHGAHVNPAASQGMMSAKTCDVCHGTLPNSGDVSHANGTIALGWGSPANAQGFTPMAPTAFTASWENAPTCTNYCHSTGKPIGGTAVSGGTATWTSTVNMQCTSCHQSGSTLTTNAHSRHVTSYGVACQACHAGTTDNGTSILSGGGLHVNGSNNVQFTTTDVMWAPYVTVGSYNATQYTCSSTYCHSNGTSSTSPFGAPVSTPLAWNGASSCTSCHGGPSGALVVIGNGAGNGSAKHVNHVSNAALIGANYFCGDCHQNTVTAGQNSPVATPANHVDRQKTISIANRGTFASTDTTATCSATYCHSSGQRGAANAKRTVSWSDAAWTDNVCTHCHGTGGLTFGAPDYGGTGTADTANANSHAKHATAATDCEACHNGYVAAAGTAITGGSHTNGIIDMGWNATRAGTPTFVSGSYNSASGTYTSATCTNVKCHGYNAAAIKWGGPAMKCSDCHMGASDTDSFAFGTAGIISSTEWSGYGHGQSTFGANTFPTTTAGTPCLYCHDGSVRHDQTGNPFRLRGATGAGGAVSPGNYSALTASSANQVCLNCHAVTGANGVSLDVSNPLKTSTKKIDAYHAGTKHAANNGGTRCWDCHDPHGDGTNLKMIGSTVVRTATDNHSWAATRITGVTFTANATGTDYAGTGTRVCNACHTGTLYYLASGTGNQTHQSGSKCIACHAHQQAPDLAFQQSTACNACHDAPPTPGSHGAHDQTTFAETGYGDNARHGSATQYGFACNTCHNGTHMNGTGPYRAEVVFGSFDTTAVGGSYGGGTAQTADTAPTGMLVFNWNNGTCSSVYCHSNASPVGGVAAAYQNPSWNGTLTGGCAGCHGYGDTGTNTMSASHAKHVRSNANSSYAYGCQKCHQPTTTDGTTIASKLNHVDGNKQNVSFDGTNPSGAYNGTTNTCASTYCHSNGNPLGGTQLSTAPTWTGAMPTNCTGCHGGNAGTGLSAIDTNKHTQHVNNGGVIGTNYGCVNCHNQTVSADQTILATSGYPLHVNGSKNVAFPLRNSMTSGNYASPNCASNYCHSSGRPATSATDTTASKYATVAWNQTGALDCKGCHGTYTSADADFGFNSQFGEPNYANGGQNVVNSNSHQKHVGAAASCAICHQQTTTNGTAINSAYDVHTNGLRDVKWDSKRTTGGASYNQANKTCSSITCHGAGSPVWGGPSMTCTSCHGTTGTETDDLGPSFWNNDVIATINTTAWGYSGHGKASGTYDTTGNPAAAFPTTPTAGTSECLYCHDSDVGHQDPTNPFRLRGVTGAGGALTSKTYDVSTADLANAPCLNCHSAAATGVNVNGAVKTATLKTAKRHAGAKHTVDTLGGKFCWDCHDPHGDSVSTAGNVAMIATKITAVSDGTYGYVPDTTNNWRAVTFNSEAASPPATGKVVETTTALNTNHVGICQACHGDNLTDTTYWTKYWNRYGYQSDRTLSSASATSHNWGSTTTPYCISCHTHATGFGGECIGCHATSQPITKGPLAGTRSRRNVVNEFKMTWSHKASSATNPANRTVSNYDCTVCHMEGNPADGNPVSPQHGDGYVNLRDPDTGSNIKRVTFGQTVYNSSNSGGSYSSTGTDATPAQFVRNLSNSAIEDDAAAIMINQCLKCHDADGATAYNGTGALAPLAAKIDGSAVKPFGMTIAGTGYSGGTGLTACPSTTAGCVTNVDDSFSTSNASYHPVRSKQNNSYIGNSQMRAPWNALPTNKTGGVINQSNSWGYLISCWDCHAPWSATSTQTSTVTAHGGVQTVRAGLWYSSIATMPVTGALTSAQGNLCRVCHFPSSYTAVSTGTNTGHGSGSAISSVSGQAGQYMPSRCHYCHFSSITKPARPIAAQDVHGFNAFAVNRVNIGDTMWPVGTANNTYRPYAFMRNVGTSTSGMGTQGGEWYYLTATAAWKPLTGPGVPTGAATCGGTQRFGACGSQGHSTYTPGGRY